MPKQLIALILVIALYSWPWQITLMGTPADWLLTVLLLQHLFVIACNKLGKEAWLMPIIMIEVICMALNVALVAYNPLTIELHSQLIFYAFIMQLLIITISMTGAISGGADSNRLPMGGLSLRGLRHCCLNRQNGGFV